MEYPLKFSLLLLWRDLEDETFASSMLKTGESYEEVNGDFVCSSVAHTV